MSVTHPAAGYYSDPDSGQQRWWDGHAWGPPAEAPAPAVRRSRPSRFWLVALLVVAIGGAWTSGSLDHVLVNVGLNYNDCVRNGFGATFCGDEATAYQQRVDNLTRSINYP